MALTLDGPLVLAGAGKMGGAMLSGWLKRGLDPARVILQDPSPAAEMSALLAEHGIRSVERVEASDTPPSVIVVAVKPQVMDQVFPGLAGIAARSTLVLSIAAGKTLATFERHLPEGAGVVRAMPNTPAAIGRGITVCVPNAHVSEEQRVLATSLLEAVGEVGWVSDETLMDAVTAVSGSGTRG